MSIFASAGAACVSVANSMPQLSLLLFKDMGLGGALSKFIGRMNDPDSGGFDGFFLPDPVCTLYLSFYHYYMTYIKVAERDAVLAAQLASPGNQVTIIHCP